MGKRVAASLLQNGVVLIAGGDFSTGTTAELYDPVAGTFTYTGNLNTPLSDHSAALLNDGTVLIAGGDSVSPDYTSPIAGAEIYKLAAEIFTATGNLNVARESPTVTLLTNGRVLIAAGSGSQGNLASAELYEVAKVFTLIGSLGYSRLDGPQLAVRNSEVVGSRGELDAVAH